MCKSKNKTFISTFRLILAAVKEYDIAKKTEGKKEQANDQEIIEANIKAVRLGSEIANDSGFSVGELAEPIKPDYEQIMITGNAAISLGSVAAGLEYYVGYPISPATTILIWMENNLIGKNKFAYQVSSEIEAINAILGAGYAGKKAMTATAGPGIALMSEGLGLAWMAEIPLVVVDVQRGGPATGLPTKSEQSDLFACMHPAHGDVKMPILAPGSVEECFYAGALAVNWAERYQGPVILMTEMSLAERVQNIQKPDLTQVHVEQRQTYQGNNGYNRYSGYELSPMPIPVNPGSYVANGSDHDEMVDTTHLPSRHIQMTERRFNKLGLLDDGTFESIDEGSRIALVPWGGTKGPALAAFNELRNRDVDLSWYYTMYLNPMPAEFLEALKEKDLVIVPELNYMGQFSSVLRTVGVRARSITQYTGLPFKARDLVRRIQEIVGEFVTEGVSI